MMKIRLVLSNIAFLFLIPEAASQPYSDNKPITVLRMDAKDTGALFKYGNGPDSCDILGARDIWVFEEGGRYVMHYDGAAKKGWLCCLAENTSLYYEKAIKTWFLFTNHIGIENGVEYTDAVWVYWTRDLNKWNPENKAVVLDGNNCKWSEKCIGLPSVIPAGNRLALFYDAPGGNSTSHMRRNVGLAWLELPLKIPRKTE